MTTSAMTTSETTVKPQAQSRFSVRGDVNGLALVLCVLVALMLLPGPGGADDARDVKMCNIGVTGVAK